MFNEALELVAKIKALRVGATAYIVGGAVRDHLLYFLMNSNLIGERLHSDRLIPPRSHDMKLLLVFQIWG